MAKKTIELEKNIKKKLVEEIIRYFTAEHELDIGMLKAELILDFITEKIAPAFYNEGLNDAQAYISNALDDIKSMEK